MSTSLKSIAFLVLASAAPAVAAVQITVSGTVTTIQGSLGYTVGQPVTFTMVTVNSPMLQQYGTSFMSYQNQGDSGLPIWASVQGTGMTGSYQAGQTPQDFLDLEDPFRLYLAGDYSTSMNITAGGQALSYFYGDIRLIETDATIVSSPSADVAFTPSAGTYGSTVVDSRSYFYLQGLVSSHTATVAVDTLTISILPVPEPSTLGFAALCGVAGLLRRRR
jgi:uncharacterized protein (TIGR03382 family)